MVARAKKNVTLNIVVFEDGVTTVEVKDNLTGLIEFASFNAQTDIIQTNAMLALLHHFKYFKWRKTQDSSERV